MRTNFDIIEFYQRTEPTKAKNWLRILNREYDEKQNHIGVKKMYNTLKSRSESYPTRRFIEDYLNRQHRHQVYKQNRVRVDSIQSIVTNRPQQLLQCDYLYFWFAHDGVDVDDARSEGPIDTEGQPGKPADPDADEKLRKVKKLFGKVKYRGAIVAIDAFSRRGYAVPIEGNINSEKSTAALKIILEESQRVYGDKYKPFRTVQSDKGSEFLNVFRNFLNDKADAEPGFYKHQFSYTGRSQANGLVERLNGSLKRGVVRALNGSLDRQWISTLKIVVANYNSNHHTTIDTSPDSVADMDAAEIKIIKERIVKKAVKQHNLDRGKFRIGSYVRIRNYKSTKTGIPPFTDGSRKFSDKEDLRALHRSNQMVAGAGADVDEDDLAGVYMIHGVRLGRGTENNTEQPGRATTYQICGAWSKESTVRSLPSSQKQAKAGKRIAIKSNDLFIGSYPTAAFVRSFTKDSLSRVPHDKAGIPIVTKSDVNDTFELVKVIREATAGDERSQQYRAAMANLSQKDRSSAGKLLYTKWKGYKDNEWVMRSDVKQTVAYEKWKDKNTP